MTLQNQKAAARQAAYERRRAARSEIAEAAANGHLVLLLEGLAPGALAGYWPIRTEIDPRPAMLASGRPLALPVVERPGRPLTFRKWSKDAAMVEGAYGASIPEVQEQLIPRHLIVPLAAFDPRGFRLGYGGGFYDRTLEQLRASGAATAIGFAFAGQGVEALPVEATDQPLDHLVTEDGIVF